MGKLNMVYARSTFKKYLNASGYKEDTIKGKLRYMKIFVDYLKKTGKKVDLREITRKKLVEFLEYLEKLRVVRSKRLLGKKTKETIFATVRQLFFVLYEQGLILGNPTEQIKYKARGKKKQRVVMQKEEIGRFLDNLTESRYLGVRDRAMFELLYATGIRAGELVKLNVEDVNFEERELLVRKGKWEKDRVVPLSDVALKFLGIYLKGRKVKKTDPLFLNSRGKNRRIKVGAVTNRFKSLLGKLGMNREGLCTHSIRHSVAVHLLANGADIRYVQLLLGHESVESTVTYTYELIENIRKIHRQYHPRDNGYRKEVDTEYLLNIEKLYEQVKKAREKSRKEAKRVATARAKEQIK